MKSLIDLFTALYSALLEDICSAYPSIRGEMERDLSRLISSMSHEGLSFVTITHLDICTYFQGALAAKAFPDVSSVQAPRGFGQKSHQDRRPAYLHGLLSLVFSNDGTLSGDADPTAILFIRQWLLMAKKTEMDCTDERLETSLREYLAIERALPQHHPHTWDSQEPQWEPRYGHPLWGPSVSSDTGELFSSPGRGDEGIDWGLFRTLCARFRAELGSPDVWSFRPKHGPGAVADGKGIVKYDFPSWPDKLQSVFPWDWFASSDFGLYKIEAGREPDNREIPSHVVAVPKTQKGPRIICKEPIAHQWMQGAVERWLVSRLTSTFLDPCVDIRDQSVSRQLALRGSIDGNLATVDLSAASDRLSTRLVEYVFQGGDNSALDVLHACRSRMFKLGSHSAAFRKFAPMGSACTFPVQSIVFSLLSTFAVMQTRGTGMESVAASAAQVRVFGDDIIIPSDVYPILEQILTTVGLKVNTSKSYHTGLFRESCGMDAYAGVDVTPAYVHQAYSPSRHTSLGSVVECANNLHMKGFWHTADAYLKTIPESERKLLFIGRNEGGAVSLYSFLGESTDHLRDGWDDKLQKEVHRTLITRSRVSRIQSDGDAGLVQFFTEEPDPDVIYASGQVLRARSIKATGWV